MIVVKSATVSFVLVFKLSRFCRNAAVAEIERENIRVQTMEGRIQKTREGKWNSGFAPYGYTLENKVRCHDAGKNQHEN